MTHDQKVKANSVALERDELYAQIGRLTAMFRQCVADETPHSLVRLTLEVARAEELVKSRWSGVVS